MTQLYLIKLFGEFGTVRNWVRWNTEEYIPAKEGEYQIVGKTKNCVHLIPKGGSMKDRISVLKKDMKVIKKVIN